RHTPRCGGQGCEPPSATPERSGNRQPVAGSHRPVRTRPVQSPGVQIEISRPGQRGLISSALCAIPSAVFGLLAPWTRRVAGKQVRLIQALRGGPDIFPVGRRRQRIAISSSMTTKYVSSGGVAIALVAVAGWVDAAGYLQLGGLFVSFMS